MKQEKFDNIGQWKHTQVENSKWNKQALSWPVTPDGQLNDSYDWPMEGYLLAYAPPTKCHGDADKVDYGSASLRLQVLRNGADDHMKAVPVVAPVIAMYNTHTHTHTHNRFNNNNNNNNNLFLFQRLSMALQQGNAVAFQNTMSTE